MAMWDGSFEPVVKKWHWEKEEGLVAVSPV